MTMQNFQNLVADCLELEATAIPHDPEQQERLRRNAESVRANPGTADEFAKDALKWARIHSKLSAEAKADGQDEKAAAWNAVAEAGYAVATEWRKKNPQTQ